MSSTTDSVIFKLLNRDEMVQQTLLDPVSKLRVCTPESLIDTDFEYGLQNTKWETLELVNNIPTIYARDNDEALPVTNITVTTGSYNVYVNCSSAHGLSVGSPIIAQGVLNYSCEGGFTVTSIPSSTQFVYRAKQILTMTGSIFDATGTVIYKGKPYQGTQYNMDSLGYIKTDGVDTITVDTLYPHGFIDNTNFILSRSTGQKQLYAPGSNIDVVDFYSYSNTNDFTATNALGFSNNYNDKGVVVHEWKSKLTAFFDNSNVNYSTNTITCSNHGFSNMDYAMYAPAPLSYSNIKLSYSNEFAKYSTTGLNLQTASYTNSYQYTYDGSYTYNIATGGSNMFGGIGTSTNNVHYIGTSTTPGSIIDYNSKEWTNYNNWSDYRVNYGGFPGVGGSNLFSYTVKHHYGNTMYFKQDCLAIGAQAGSIYERYGMYNNFYNNWYCSWGYWGVYNNGTRPSFYYIIVSMQPRGSDNYPSLTWYTGTGTGTAAWGSITNTYSSYVNGTYSPCYTTVLLVSKKNGGQITQGELSTLVSNMTLYSANITDMFGIYRYPNTYIFNYDTVGDYYLNNGGNNLFASTRQNNIYFIAGNRLSYLNRNFTKVPGTNNGVEYKFVSDTQPQMMIARIMNGGTYDFTFSNYWVSGYGGSLDNWWFGSYNEYGWYVYWGYQGIYQRGSGRPSIYYLFMTMRSTNYGDYPYLQMVSTTQNGFTNNFTVRSYNNVQTYPTYFVSVMITIPDGYGAINNTWAGYLVRNIMSQCRFGTDSKSQNSANGYWSSLIRNNYDEYYEYNVIGNLVPYQLYQVNVVDQHNLRLQDIPYMSNGFYLGNEYSCSLSITYNYGNGGFMGVNFVTNYINLNCVASARSRIYSYYWQVGYSQYGNNYYYVQFLDNTSTVRFQTPGMGLYGNGTQMYFKDQYSSNFVMGSITGPTYNITQFKLFNYDYDWRGNGWNGNNWDQQYLRIYWYDIIPFYALNTTTGTKTLSNSGPSIGLTTTYRHSLHKAFRIANNANLYFNFQRNAADTVSIENNDAVYIFQSPQLNRVETQYTNGTAAQSYNDAYRGNYIHPNIIPTNDNLMRNNITRYTVNSGTIVYNLFTSMRINLNGSLQSLGGEYTTFPGTTWAIIAQDIPQRNCIYHPNHGIPDNNAIVYTTPSGLGIRELNSNQTYFTGTYDNNFYYLRETSGGQTLDLSFYDGIGKFNYNITNANANTVFISDHGLAEGTQILFTSPDSNLPPLTSGSNYFAVNVTKDRFRVGSTSTSSSAINLTGTTLNTSNYFTISTVGATDGIYVTTQAGNRNSTILNLKSPYTIPAKLIVVNPFQCVNITYNTLYLPSHKLKTGAYLKYFTNANTAISPLQDGNEYWAIRIDDNHIQLSSSYADSRSGTFLTISSLGTGTYHTLFDYSVGGEVISTTSSINITAGTNIVNGSVDSNGNATTQFTSDFKPGNLLNAIVDIPQYDDYVISSLDTGSYTITLNKTIGFATGDPVVYAPTVPKLAATLSTYGVGYGNLGTLTKNNIYYARVITTTNIRLYATLTDANANTNVLQITSGSIGVITSIRPTSVYSFKVSDIRSNKIMAVDVNSPFTLTNAKYFLNTNLFVKADGTAMHRAYDGGVELIAPKNSDSQMIRQTRKYFRYQPGKGIQVSTSINFSAPVLFDRLYRVGTVAYGVTKRPHRLSVGLRIAVIDSSDTAWNGSYTVASMIDETTFTFNLTVTPSDFIAPGIPSFYVDGWVNSFIRVGLYDDQNGLFFEYDGNKLYCVRRSSTTQLGGTINVVFNSPVITGNNTVFTTQLVINDMVVIKGQSYKVVFVESNTKFYVQPVYRGASMNNILLTKTFDTRVPQENWSIDKCDGNGPTGYNLNIHKIQMSYIDYSWYGAGKARFGFKALNGDVRYVNEMLHNNIFTEAYFRSGNLPCRYEVKNVGYPTYVPSLAHWGTAVIMDGRYDDDKAYLFTAPGQLLSFSGNFNVTVNTNTMNNTIGLAYNTRFFVYDSTRKANVYAYAIWTATSNYNIVKNVRSGTAIIAPGYLQTGTVAVTQPVQFSNGVYIYIDRVPSNTSFTNIATIVGSGTDPAPSIQPLISMRLAPSVDNSRPAALGVREVINRMQLHMKSVGVLTTHDCEIRLMLNGLIDNKTFTRVTSPSLSQLVYHNKNDGIDGGTQIYSFRVPGGTNDSTGKRTSISTTADLTGLINLGNSIQGGDGIYPDGPDVLTVCASIIDTSDISASSPFTVTGRVTWTENQA